MRRHFLSSAPPQIDHREPRVTDGGMFGIGNNFADVVPTAATIQMTGLSSAMALTFLAWDILTSFSDEVRFIWQTPNGWVRWLYAFVRYVPMLTEMWVAPSSRASMREPIQDDDSVLFAVFSKPTTSGSCAAGTLAEAVLMEFIIVAVELVLLIRVTDRRRRPVYALYGRSRKVLLVLLAGFTSSICVTAFGMYYAADGFTNDGQCLVTASPRIVLLVWLSPVAFELVLFGLTLFKFGESRRQRLGKRPILDTLIRDGTWAFLCSLVVMTLNALGYTIYSNTLSSIFYFWALSALSSISWDAQLTFTEMRFDASVFSAGSG
ncbi:hypothetical protein C8Q78DRAFT_1076102 [Trametes maxima]|nr:hypothetical protein C8Q78DRAFT_1076102 [Trametes maxima]